MAAFQTKNLANQKIYMVQYGDHADAGGRGGDEVRGVPVQRRRARRAAAMELLLMYTRTRRARARVEQEVQD